MNHPRKYQRLAEPAMIELLPEPEISGVTLLFSELESNLPENYFERLVAKGEAASTIIAYEGKPVYRLIWQQIKDGAELVVLLAQQIADCENICVLGTAIDKLAESLKVRAATLSTARRSLVLQCVNWGAAVFAVKMRKNYAPAQRH